MSATKAEAIVTALSGWNMFAHCFIDIEIEATWHCFEDEKMARCVAGRIFASLIGEVWLCFGYFYII